MSNGASASGPGSTRSAPEAPAGLRPAGDDPSRTERCEHCQGNGEIVTDWERYLHASEGDKGDEAVIDCPECDGTGVISTLPTGLRRSDFDSSRWAKEFGVDIAVAVSELPDRTSPEDWPEAMLVEASELSAIIESRILDELDHSFEAGREEGYSAGARDVVDPTKHHRAIMASVRLGAWMSAALDDPNVCDAMKDDIREWFSAGEPQPGWGAHISDSDGNPKGQDREDGLGAKHDSAGPKDIAQGEAPNV